MSPIKKRFTAPFSLLKFCKITFSIFLLVAIERFCYTQTGSFNLSKMLYVDSPQSILGSTALPHHIPLRFLGAGKQFYAFETSDQKYVVKFMKWRNKRPVKWLETAGFPFSLAKEKFFTKKKQSASTILESVQIAYQHLQDETKVILPTEVKSWNLVDKLGIFHTVEARQTFSYAQHKAELFTNYFIAHPEEKKALLHSLIQTVKNQCLKGIINTDPCVSSNFGVLDKKVIIIDAGSFKYGNMNGDKMLIHQEVVKELQSLQLWLKKNDPSFLQILEQLIIEELG